MNTTIEARDLSGRCLQDYETPKLVVDRWKLERNIARMTDRAAVLGVDLRPHMKTAKCIEIAKLATEGREPRITVSTLKEAEFFAEAGFRDILYAVGFAPHKASQAARLRRAGVDLSLILDSVAAATALSDAAVAEGVDFPILIEIDTDGHRAGLKPRDPLLVELARVIDAAPGLSLKGVMTHAGESYHCDSLEAIADMAEIERSGAVAAADLIRASGIACLHVSVGSTPTATFARALEGVTELRAGVHVFHDLVMAGLGVCTLEDLALSVLTTVIGHQSEKGWVITDGGWMALAGDRGTASQPTDQGYGIVCNEEGRVLGDVIVVSANQEHGIIAGRPGSEPLDISRFPVGTRLRVLPNHACATAAQHDRYLVVGEDGTRVEAEWLRSNGW